METVFNILFIILGVLLCGAIGGLITLKCLEKDMDELIASYNGLVECYHKIMVLDDEIIAEERHRADIKRRIILKTYSDLVNLRDTGTENLDELIGYLGEILDDHKEG